jgi:hypothetical protein
MFRLLRKVIFRLVYRETLNTGVCLTIYFTYSSHFANFEGTISCLFQTDNTVLTEFPWVPQKTSGKFKELGSCGH